MDVEMFKVYDTYNPEIWQAFEQFTLDVIQRGRGMFGAKAIMERVRWYTVIERVGKYKISNSSTAFYARKFLLKYPGVKIFQIRKSVADELCRDDFDANWIPILRNHRNDKGNQHG